MLEHFDIIRSLKFLPGIIIGLTVHEFCHAWVAQKCGDMTSKEMGRVTLNPLKHIDPLGFIFLLLVGFGWAKPVHFNEQNLKNPKYDIIKIAIAGPLSNGIIAMLFSILFSLATDLSLLDNTSASQVITDILLFIIFINWGLFVFNLIPIPPLDGSHLIFSPLRKFPSFYHGLYRYGTYIFIGLLIISSVTQLDLLPIWPVIKFLGGGFLSLVGAK